MKDWQRTDSQNQMEIVSLPYFHISTYRLVFLLNM